MASNDPYRTFWPRLGAAALDIGALAPLAWVDQILWNVSMPVMALIVWTLLYQLAWLFYSIGFVYSVGQTPGKIATGVEILDYRGNRLALRQAILRDIVPVITGAISLVFVINNLLADQVINRGMGNLRFLLWLGFGGIAWGVLEFLTMMSNSRRRAIHDYIAQTVVIRQPIAERWSGHRNLRWSLIALLVLSFIVPEFLPEQNMRPETLIPLVQ